MIYPVHNRLYKTFFDFYTRKIISSDFNRINIESTVSDFTHRPLLVVSNHFSWWDGFLHYHLNNIFYKKRYHVMMLEEQLSKRMFLTRLGIFGVKKGTRDAINSLRFASNLLKEKQNMVLIFPQGKIESQHQHSFTFERGTEVLITENPGACVLFSICLTDYFSERKPVANFYFKEYSVDSDSNLQIAFNDFFQKCLKDQLKLN